MPAQPTRLPAIEVEHLGFRHVGRKRPTLRDVSFRVQRGESVLILGPSGSGKSTLALCLNGAIPHAVGGKLHGTVRVDGADTRAASMGWLARRVGIVFQDPDSQFCMLTVEDEVAFGLENLAVPPAEMDARIDEALAMVGLARRRREQIARLSGGQKQRLALACVLAQGPEVLVLDEPTSQLDPAGAAELIALLGELRRRAKHTLIVVEHRLDAIMHLIDRVLVLDAEGVLVADGPPRAVLRQQTEQLAASGVWVPLVSELALALERQGLIVDPFPLTVAEAADALAPHVARLRVEPAARFESAQGAYQPAAISGAANGSSLHVVGDSAHASAVRTRGAGRSHGATATSPLLDVRGLSYRYPRADATALRDVSFSLRAGELVAIIGENGAGKSTLARLLTGILAPPRGAVRLHGRDVATLPRPELARQVGYVFQNPEHQFVGATVLDDVAYGLRRLRMPEAAALARARVMIADVGLTHLEAAHPFTLSHGEQRRLSVASMLVLGQELLVLDEPTYGQDRRNAIMLLDHLDALRERGRTLVVVTHDMRVVAERAGRVLVLADGALLFDGPPATLFSEPDLLRRARLEPPPLWELSRRLGLRTPILTPDSVRVLGADGAESERTAIQAGGDGRPSAVAEANGAVPHCPPFGPDANAPRRLSAEAVRP